MRRLRPVLIIATILVPLRVALAQPAADVVITNAKVWTGDPALPLASTILIDGERIKAVGGEALAASARSAHVIDAQGRLVVPGLIDSHAHIISGGLGLTQLQLRDATGRTSFIRLVREYASKLKSDEWVLGRGWSVESWDDQTEPTKEWIDEATDGRPALLERMDGHQALANSRALSLANIANSTSDPAGGVIVKDPVTGQPTGILKDAAVELVAKLVPVPDTQRMTQAFDEARKVYLSLGVTCVHTMAEESEDLNLQLPHSQRPVRGQPPLRVYTYLQPNDWLETASYLRATEPIDCGIASPYKGLKAYMDGSLGSRTAYMRDPYLDNPPDRSDDRGLLMEFATQSPDMVSQFRVLAEARHQPAVHAIGDQANHLLLDAYEQLKKEFPAVRPRIEHAQHLLPEDIPRFGKIGVIASMQPYHKADDGRYAEKRLGAERCKTSYAFKSLVDSGAVVCFGSDWPVVSNNPMLGIHAAVTGKTLDGKVFVPEQNITVEQALKCYTVNAAYACNMEDKLGMIKEGYLADLVILDQDILSIEVEKIPQTKVVRTIVGGRTVWPVQ